MNWLPAHQDLTAVADWVDGRLDADAAAAMAERVAKDPELRAHADFVRRVVASGASLPLIEPPALVRQKLRQQFRRWVDQQPTRTTSMLELVGTLIFDSRRQRLALATRGRRSSGRSPNDVVHLVYRTELAELVLEARAESADTFRLDGQVLLEHESVSPVFEAEVTGPGVTVAAVDGDTLGRFQLRASRQANRLRVSNGEFSILADLDLGGGDPP